MSEKQPRSLWKKASNIILSSIKDENRTSNLGSQLQELHQPSLFKGLAEKKEQSEQPYLDPQTKRALYQGKQLTSALEPPPQQSQVPLRKASISNGIVSTSISKRDSVLINPVLSGGQNSTVHNSFSANFKDDQDDKSKPKQTNVSKNTNINNTRSSNISDTKSKDAFKDFLTPEVLSSQMRSNQLKISDLSMTKYNSVLSGREEIFFAGGLSTDLLLNGQFHNPQPLPAPIFTLPPINKSTKGFISFDQVRQVNASILQSLENEIDALCESQQMESKTKMKQNLSLEQMKLKVMLKESESLFAEKKRKGNWNDRMNSRLDTSGSVTKSFLEQSFTKAGDRSFIKTSIYSPRKRLQFTLQHNKFNQGQLTQIDEKLLQSSSGRLEAILNREQSILHKQRIRNTPTALSSSQEHLQFLNKLSITEPAAETANQRDSPQFSHHSEMFVRNENNKHNRHQQQQHRLAEVISEPQLRVIRQEIVNNGDQLENIQNASGNKKKKENARISTDQGRAQSQNSNNVYICAKGKQLLDVEGKWKPSIREMFRVCQIGDTAYLFGGCTGLPSLDISAYNLNGGGWCEWDRISSAGEGRYGHVMAVYKKTLLVFGGEKREGPEYCHHVCVNETRIYYPDRKEWKYMRPTGDVIEARKSAASTVVGRCLIVHGGINQTGQYLSDLWTLDISSQRWNQSLFEDKSQLMSEGRAYHKACAVYHPDRKNVELYRDNIPDKQSEKLETEIRHEGVYFFGGQLERGQASDKLAILLTNTKPMVFMQPQTLGKPPSRDVYLMRMLIVYGGMDENLNGSQAFFSDMHVLLLGDLQWKECQIFSSNQLQPRSCHEAICHNNQLFIFGGSNPDEFYSFDVDLVDLEQQKVRSRIIEGQMQAKKTEIGILKNQKTIKGFEATTNNKKRKELMEQHENFLITLKEQQEGLRTIVEKLNYKNYKSFLPAPLAIPLIPSASHKRNQLDQLKGELDKEVAVHVGADRIANFEMIQALANSGKSSPSPRSTPRSSALHSRNSEDLSAYQGQHKKSIVAGQRSPMQNMKPK